MEPVHFICPQSFNVLFILLTYSIILSSFYRVNTMAWDETMSILYIGGSFHAVDNITISSGLAMWSRRTGLISFPGGGVSNGDGGVGNTQVKSIAYEPKSEVCYVKLCRSLSSAL